MKLRVVCLFLNYLLFCASIAGCAHEDPGSFEPDESKPVSVIGCEEWKRRDAEADCGWLPTSKC